LPRCREECRTPTITQTVRDEDGVKQMEGIVEGSAGANVDCSTLGREDVPSARAQGGIPAMTDRPQDWRRLTVWALPAFESAGVQPAGAERPMRLKHKSKRGLAVVALALSLSACVSTGVDDYEGFRSALEKDAPCSELIDMRDGLSGADRDKATADLEEIGC
jgi:hypothetical protein